MTETAASQTALPAESRALLQRLFQLGWRYRGAALAVIAIHVLQVAITLSGLSLAGLGIDVIRHAADPSSPPPQWPLGIAPPADWSPMRTVIAIAAAVLLVALVTAGVRYAAALSVTFLSQRVLVQLRSDVYEKLQRLNFHFYDRTDSSSIINRAAGDVNAVRMFVDGVLIKVLIVVLSLAVYVAYMASVHLPLTIACLLTSPLLWWGAAAFSKMVQPAYRRGSELVDKLIQTLVESVQGIQVIKGFAREPEQFARFREANQAIRDQKEKIFRRISVYQPLMGLLTQVNMLVLIGYGGYLVIHGQLSLGAGMFVFANLLHEFANQVGHVTNIANTIQTSLIGASRVFEVLDAPLPIASPPDAVPLPRARGELRFEQVSFAYGNGPAVLQDVSLTIQPGECIGIVGETGSGKSTLLSLLPRFYDATSGRVLVDGLDVRSLDLDDLRRNIGLVFQESFLFSNTVAANIAFGQPDAGDDEIAHTARLAAAAEFVEELPLRYETLIGEHGSNLSGGQRQRLAIARALLLDPPILVLDDATTAVDPETEHEIHRAIDSATRGRTTLVVSNRISTLRRCDRIYVLHHGRILQTGTHAELVRSPGYYRRLAEIQFADLSDDAPRESPLNDGPVTPASGLAAAIRPNVNLTAAQRAS